MPKEKKISSEQLLREAIENGCLEAVEKYLKLGINIKDKAITTLRIGSNEIITLLVPHISESYKESQYKFKIKPEAFESAVTKLLNLTYTLEEANKIILQKSYVNRSFALTFNENQEFRVNF